MGPPFVLKGYEGVVCFGGSRDDGGGYGKMTELSDIIDVWSYRSFLILIYVEVGGYNGF